MMRKTLLVLLGAASGVALTLMATQPRLVKIGFGSSAKAAAADTYRQLNLFGDVFERVRAEYVEKPEDIRPALERAKKAIASGKSAIVCVVTDWRARATTTAFTRYAT